MNESLKNFSFFFSLSEVNLNLLSWAIIIQKKMITVAKCGSIMRDALTHTRNCVSITCSPDEILLVLIKMALIEPESKINN